MRQGDLFDRHGSAAAAALPAAARATDAASSHAAAARHTASGRRGVNMLRVLALVAAAPGATSVELYEAGVAAARGTLAPALDRHEVSRRLADLEDAGLVRRGAPRACRVRGSVMLTWWPAATPPAEAV